jgi:hypothetical protein
MAAALAGGAVVGDMLPGSGALLDGALFGGGTVDGAAALVTEGGTGAGVLLVLTAGGAVGVVVPVEPGGVFVAVVASPWDERRNSIQPTMIMLTTSNATIAIAHIGNRDFGGATLTSNSAGPDCRWRSLSDFFSASRMNDIVQLPWASAR